MEKPPLPDRNPRPELTSPADAPELQYQLTAESGDVHTDGRIDINLESKVAKSLAQIADQQEEDLFNPPPDYSEAQSTHAVSCDIKLNIVIQIVGSRGDVQPFIALGNALQRHGHRIRIATHGVFEDFMKKSYLEFFPIGGDPAQLMAYMVKNPGLIPQIQTLRDGEIKKKQKMVAEMLDGCWKSCIEDDPVTQEPFVADAIIANPPSFAHVHCAQALGIPVHLMFTMPWSSTRAFPHPLANLHAASMERGTANWVSYGVVEWLTWQGLGDVINRWRSSIDLAPVPMTEGPCLAEVLEIPMTYCWSPGLVPRPRDWPAHIDVCGFFFAEPSSYTPPSELAEFLQAGAPPVYIGFGSIVVDDPQRLIDTVLTAVARTGVRAIVSKGWSELAGPAHANVFYIGDCPHDWLFQHVAAVVHHGGAGTTACGLLNGRPTAIVPFFGEYVHPLLAVRDLPYPFLTELSQPFWGNMVAKAGAGPEPIPHASLNPQNLAAAIELCLTPEALVAAQEISIKMQSDSGVKAAVDSFHRNLPLDRMRCSVLPDQAAVWTYGKGKRSMHLSKTAMSILIEHGRIDAKNIKCYNINPIIIVNRRWDPLTGVLSAAAGTGSNMLRSTGEIFTGPYRELQRGRSRPSAGSLQDLTRSTSSDISGSRTNKTGLDDQTQPQGSRQPIRRSQSEYQRQDPFETAGNMAGAAVTGFGKFSATYFRGVIVDIPHAAAEGFRRAPQLYGEKVKDYGTVHDWKSGVAVGGKNFVGGMTNGVTGLFSKPLKGLAEEGTPGAVKGLARGTLGLATKMPSAGIGLVAYPFYGISKSIEAAFRTKTPKEIVAARLRDGYAHAHRMELSQEEEQEILQVFDALLSSMSP
ncbi:Sterol 3-beta-glucosyltransferase [Penicillium hispanicum]|uniref:Sterol 3-beta-glucosyltransferase n=1 Tax=Penicillium hispanicum TaxID=1080232 RepID=UPI00254045DA|nr:Sterol 3-beta-glucosyltransferase [Penicillium hispanicum]KAJ5569933.1 Sterol 3-beta-glucosyltransferase [Penicillium hispanicum]